MRVLLDACVPIQLRLALVGHEVQSAKFARLDGLLDKDLLQAADAMFDVLVTCDRSLRWQQNLDGCSISVLVLVAPTNRLPDLLPLVPELLRVLGEIERGEVREIEVQN